MFSKILVANRGEIACRIIKTAKTLNIKTVAVFSEIDANAMHVTMADEAFELGPAAPNKSYLNGSRIIELALASGANAIHPGYGFLSENAEFADACNEAGLVFIGPSPDVIASMGIKDEAKSIIEKANIPTTPGYHGKNQSLTTFTKAANTIGYPVLLKAVAGGGGKGMRLVNTENDLMQAMESAKREANTSFGDDRLFLEKYLENARHVELQVFADSHGNYVHLFDRDCSIQRRHQKIIEEAPAPFLSDATRKAMQDAAIKILEITDYLGAGTIEFLVDKHENFYFMEMNTRLQVEHPVTEMITGLDLVEWQIRVAAGEPLPLKQSEIKISGHAIEARICAEDPQKDFTPSIGALAYLDFPEPEAFRRIDTGVQMEDQISPYYDSMIAKVITHANNREDAILQLKQALSETHIVGVETNIPFLLKICQANDFITGKINTAFIGDHSELFKFDTSITEPYIIAASFYRKRQLTQYGHQLSHESNDPNSPWFIRDNWRLNSKLQQAFELWNQGHAISIEMSDLNVRINNKSYKAELIWEDDTRLSVSINNESFNASIIFHQNTLHVFAQTHHYQLQLTNLSSENRSAFENDKHLKSPMPGNIIEVFVKPGDSVKAGDKLIILEAMKMEHQIRAPSDGKVLAVHNKPGDSVVEGVKLIDIEPYCANQPH